MTSLQIQTAFKSMGKFIKLAQLAESHVSTLKQHVMATNDQVTDATDDNYDIYRYAVFPLESSMNRIIDAVDGVPARAKQAIENYLTLHAAALGVSAGASAVIKADALKAKMAAAAQYVEPSGGGNTDGFYSYFKDNYNVSLPNNSTATVPDSWITTTIV